MVSGMIALIAVMCASGLGMVAVMYWQLHRQFVCLQLELQRLSRQYRRTRRNCIELHQRLNTVEENQADLMGQDDFSAPHWRAGSNLCTQNNTESDSSFLIAGGTSVRPKCNIFKHAEMPRFVEMWVKSESRRVNQRCMSLRSD